jgi:3-hydroxyisobutyrate dehydrogenase
MGSAIARNLLSRNYEVHGYNRTREKTKPLAEIGAIIHSTPRDAVEGDVNVVITMCTDQDAVQDVALGKDGFLPNMTKESLWIDMSTILPEASTAHAAECEKRGVERLDAPVIGGPELAGRGELVIVVGGKQDVYSKHLNFLKQLGKEVILAGPPGTGHKMKLAFNLYLADLAAGFSEALVFAEKLGIKASDFVGVVNKTNHRNSYTEVKGVRVSKNEFTPTFTLKMIHKDLGLIVNEAILNRISLPTTASAFGLYSSAMNEGLSELDYSSIAIMLRRINGIS